MLPVLTKVTARQKVVIVITGSKVVETKKEFWGTILFFI